MAQQEGLMDTAFITKLDVALKEALGELIQNEKNAQALKEQKKAAIAMVNSSMDEIIQNIDTKRQSLIDEINERALEIEEKISEHKGASNNLKQLFLNKRTEIDEISTSKTELNKPILIKQIVDNVMNEYETFKKNKPNIDNIKITVNINNINASIAQFCYVGIPTANNNNNDITECGNDSGSFGGFDKNDNKISDEIDPVNEKLEFEHRPARVWRWDQDQQKWRGRGKGKMNIYYNKQKGVAKIVFVDEKHEKTRQLQYIDGKQHCQYARDDNIESNNDKTKVNKEEIEWEGADYTMDQKDPMIGRWKVQFTGDEDAAEQFKQTFNKYIDAVPDNDDDKNDDDNGNVHEHDILMEQFAINKLYRWCQDVSGQQCWKNRASNTVLKIYRETQSGKIRLVCHENITSKLRLNQWIAPPSRSHIEYIIDRKNKQQISWAGLDRTIEEEDGNENQGYYMFAAKFSDADTADKFYQLFVSSSVNNEDILKRD